MKSIAISSVIAALLFLTGCSDKDPVVDSAQKDGSKSAQETVIVDSVKEEVVGDGSTVSSSSNDITSAEKDFSTVYFDFDKFNIRPDMKDEVSKDADVANSSAANFTIKLEGNCDEWGSDEYNFALGLKRSNTVKKALVAEGVNANRITMVSYGESNPVCTNKTRDCWAQNRRVDFKLLP